jgi:hypothetical protein
MTIRRRALGAALLLAAVGGVLPGAAQRFVPEIPRTWDSEEIASFELPLATPAMSPVHVPEDWYYALPVRPIYRSYPVYHPAHEPPGYLDSLRAKEPEVIFDAERLETEADWIAAGRAVFEAPVAFGDAVFNVERLHDPEWWRSVDPPLSREGTLAGLVYVVRERGSIEVGSFACATCHTRVLDDGSVVAGAQGNFPLERAIALAGRELPEERVRLFATILYSAPWMTERERELSALSKEELIRLRERIPDGVIGRQGTDIRFPSRIPDLIGIEDRRYLDATGFVRHRGTGDIMRYAATNQGMDVLARHGDFIAGVPGHRELPPPGSPLPLAGSSARYTDEQLYALALYLYSLEPPPNPNPKDELAARGEAVFRAQRCGRCHTPPLYTDNRLVPAPGFEPPAEHRKLYDVSDERVDTDPTLAMATRRGTGYYKVPSLRGLWYRGPLEHNGSVATLEDWFDPARFEPSYRPTGWGPDAEPRAVEGHPFGVALPEEERRALIAFLRTL